MRLQMLLVKQKKLSKQHIKMHNKMNQSMWNILPI